MTNKIYDSWIPERTTRTILNKRVGMTSGRSLFDFLLRGIRPWVEDAFGQMLDESDSLSDADLLLLGQLTGQATLPWGGVVYWRRLGLFLGNRKHKTQVCSASNSPLGEGGAYFTSPLLLLVRLSKFHGMRNWDLASVCVSHWVNRSTLTHTHWVRCNMASYNGLKMCVRVCVRAAHGCCLKAAVKLLDTTVLCCICTCSTLRANQYVAGHRKQASSRLASRGTAVYCPGQSCE